MKLKRHDKFLCLHLFLFGVLFIFLLTSTISSSWSTSRTGHNGLFSQCHLVYFCQPNNTATYQFVQMLSILSCITCMVAKLYCFSALLIHKYIQSKLYLLAIGYVICGMIVILESIIYSVLLHQSIHGETVNYGWSFYLVVMSTLLCFIGSCVTLFYYKEEKEEPVLLVEWIELYQYNAKRPTCIRLCPSPAFAAKNPLLAKL